FSWHCCADHLELHSSPTRRSSDLGNATQQSLHVVDHIVDQPGAQQNHRNAHGQQLGDEGQRHLVDLGGCLENTDAQTYHQHHDQDRKSTRLNSSHVKISYAVFCLK